ncbi:MAG: hypothetical protein SOZ80_06380 [Prevotella sp.]|uniref:hypothetical protein n=1 Tax=Prevotella sp. TaxID=59823 RepID=UPI002A2C008B|nr:hypothetical protein [Prevotella sp.]MDD7318580.1 hypothetical protein [Prevotellaceae bacterium]MDY4020381.1 hypothetical protein [Prevotella sp.]
MKKTLLLAFAAMLSFAASAQVKVAKFERSFAIKSNVQMAEKLGSATVAENSFDARKIDAAGLYGTWMSNEYSDETSLYTCTRVDIEAVNNVQDANVKISFITKYGTDFVYGTFADNKITVKAGAYVNDAAVNQLAGSKLYFAGATEGDQPGYIGISQDDFYFQITEDGSIEPGEGFVGWVIIIEEGQYQGQLWSSAIEFEIHKTNGVLTGKRYQGDKNFDLALPVYVKDNGAELSIFGHYGDCRIKMDVDETAGTFTITTPQNVIATSKQVKDEGYGDYYYIKGTNSEGRFVAGEPVKGTCKNNVITFNEPKEGDYSGVYSISTNVDAEGAAYGIGYFANVVVNYTNGVAGVENVVTDAVKNDNRIFNLAGQQVGKDYKGIVIKNGVKMVQK